jgi:hypothetical protein
MIKPSGRLDSRHYFYLKPVLTNADVAGTFIKTHESREVGDLHNVVFQLTNNARKILVAEASTCPWLLQEGRGAVLRSAWAGMRPEPRASRTGIPATLAGKA